MTWLQQLRRGFEDRKDLSIAELMKEFDLTATQEAGELAACLATFTEEYGISAGRLRRTDSLLQFVKSDSGGSAIMSVFDDFARQDRLSESNYELRRRRKRLGIRLERALMTVGDYVDAWLGRGEFS
jgi:replication fork clamp-binding protein CrfC